MTLFTYTIPYDDGSAPNPFHGLCTLAICKPTIRRTARPGDWVAGLGAKGAPSGDLSGKLVYAMRVEQVLPLKDYDSQAAKHWPRRVPNVLSLDSAERLGDCIYDFSGSSVVQRPGVHGPGNQIKDLGGKNVLISKHFFYFGSKAIPLPPNLKGLIHQTQGHKSDANELLQPVFEAWITSLALQPGQLYGWPDFIIDWTGVSKGYGCPWRACDDEQSDA
jgi:hypothetical protein